MIRRHCETLDGEIYGDEKRTEDEYEEVEREYTEDRTIPDLYGKFLQCFFELSEGDPLPG
jgi:hypothetical protein